MSEMTDLTFFTGRSWEWQLNEREGKWYCEQHSNEIMRMGADGSLSFGRAAPLKSYEFRTREFAEVCKRRMEEMDRAFAHQTECLTLNLESQRIAVLCPLNQFEFRLAGQEIVRIGPSGSLERIDLPWLVLAWLRTTPLARGLKTFWYGERGAK